MATSETATSSSRGPYAKGVARRQEILERTLQLCEEVGVEAASLRTIADAIGISHTTLRHYFPTREELLVEALALRESRRLETRRADQPLLEEMRGDVRTNVRTPGLVALYTALMGSAVEPHNTAAREYFTARFARVRARVAAKIRADQAAGIVRADVDAELLAAAILGISDGLQVQWLLDPTTNIEAGLTSLLSTLLRPGAAAAGDGPAGASSSSSNETARSIDAAQGDRTHQQGPRA